jgi:hypothetical protein
VNALETHVNIKLQWGEGDSMGLLDAVKKDISAHCAYSTQHQANKQEMVSHVVKPKVRRSPKATSLRKEALANPKACAQAAFISHQRGRPCLTKCALAQTDISRQELEASMSGLFVRLGVEQ